jgi:putative lipoprotein
MMAGGHAAVFVIGIRRIAMRNTIPPHIRAGIALVLGIVALVAAGDPGDRSLRAAASIEGTPWQLTQYRGPSNAQVPALAAAAPTATFSGGMVTGSTGCNSYTAAYTLTGAATLTIKPGAATLRACPEPIATQERAFLAALSAVAGYSLTGTTLTLTDASGNAALTFAPAAPSASGMPAPGAGSATLTGTVTYRERIALPAGAVITVQLADTARADAPATIVGGQTITTTGEQVPIPFAIAYDPTSIVASHQYTVRATISVGGAVTFRTTSAYPVLTNGNPTRADLVLTMAGPGAESPPAVAPTIAAPPSAPRTGDGGAAAFIRRLGDG